jgi:phosphoglycolate phosphatase-like HAD superfamily hydrolase
MSYCVGSINSIVFDCDGVLLNSNEIKTQAFFHTALPYGEEAATLLVNYHINNGGISRYHKLKYFLSEIIPSGASGPVLEELIIAFSVEVKKRLLECEISPCLFLLRKNMQSIKWFIVSGGDHDELNEVFKERGLSEMFDGGIYGSPRTKIEILDDLTDNNLIKFPSLFLGDSKYDHEVATRANIDFVFVSDWSELSDWRSYCKKHKINNIKSICDLIAT